MIGIKRKQGDACPLCSSQVEEYPINYDCSVEICNNPKCTYPFNDFSAEELIIETPNTTNKRYSNKSSNLVSSSTVINPVALPTPVPDEMTIATPAKKARTGAYQPVSGSSTIKQTDQLHSKPLLLDAKSVSNKENLPIAPASVVSPSINTAAKPKRITTTKSAPIPDLVTQESLFEILNIPVTDSRLKTQSSSSDLLNTPFTTSAENSFDDILNTPLTIDTSSTPFMFDTSLFNDTESQNPATDSSSTTSPICHTSPSNSSISAVNDACFSDISDVYSPPSSIELASSLQVNKKNITQTSPKQKTVAMPGNLALPPASAAKTVSNNNNSKYTMADINNLLNDNNDIIPATPATTTTTSASVTNWINDFDYLFP